MSMSLGTPENACGKYKERYYSLRRRLNFLTLTYQLRPRNNVLWTSKLETPRQYWVLRLPHFISNISWLLQYVIQSAAEKRAIVETTIINSDTVFR
jgi:hypothetical protein